MQADCHTIKGGGDHDHDHDHKHHHHHHDHDHDHDNDHDHKGSGGDKGHCHDTINLGSGHDTHCHAGSATVHGSVEIRFSHISHSATMAGGSHSSSFLHAAHHSVGSDSVASASHRMVSFVSGGKVSHDVIKNFVSGHDKVSVASNALTYLHNTGSVSISHGNTHIGLHGGATTVELKGFSHLTSVDSSHKG